MLYALALSTLARAEGTHAVELGGRIQARGTLELPSAEDAEASSALSIPRARLKAKGHAFDEDFTYALQADFGKGQVSLKDALVTLGTDGDLKLTVGQFKKPFGREQLTSSGKQGQVDRAITDKAFGNGRDVGLMLHNGIGKKEGLSFAAGAFNGASTSEVPERIAPLVVGRVAWTSEGMKAYSDVDLEGGGLRLAVGANSEANLAEGAGTLKHGVDAAVKASGVHLTGGVYTSRAQSGEAFGEQEGELFGVYGQGSFCVGGRYALVAGAALVQEQGATEQEIELLVGFGWFPHGHDLKWQTDVGRVASYGIPGTDEEALRVRTQLQLAF